MHGDESLAKGLVAKPDGTNVIPRTQRWKEREESQKLSSVSTSVPRHVPIPPQFFLKIKTERMGTMPQWRGEKRESLVTLSTQDAGHRRLESEASLGKTARLA